MLSFGKQLLRKIKKYPKLYFLYLLFKNTFTEFGRDGCFLMSAGIAFFAVLSIFPILLIGISFAGFTIGAPDVIDSIENFLSQVLLPTQSEIIMSNVRAIADDRGKVGILGILFLMWTGRGMFLAMEHSLNRAWGNPWSRSVIDRNLIAFSLIFMVGIILLLSMVLATVSAYVTQLQVPILNISLSSLAFWSTVNKWLISTILIFTVFSLLFKVLPHTKVTFKEVLPGAIFSTTAWKIAEFVYIWYISNMAKFSEIYGSIGGLVGILLWLYIAAIIFLLGAEFNIVYLRIRRREI